MRVMRVWDLNSWGQTTEAGASSEVNSITYLFRLFDKLLRPATQEGLRVLIQGPTWLAPLSIGNFSGTGERFPLFGHRDPPETGREEGKGRWPWGGERKGKIFWSQGRVRDVQGRESVESDIPILLADRICVVHVHVETEGGKLVEGARICQCLAGLLPDYLRVQKLCARGFSTLFELSSCCVNSFKVLIQRLTWFYLPLCLRGPGHGGGGSD